LHSAAMVTGPPLPSSASVLAAPQGPGRTLLPGADFHRGTGAKLKVGAQEGSPGAEKAKAIQPLDLDSTLSLRQDVSVRTCFLVCSMGTRLPPQQLPLASWYKQRTTSSNPIPSH
jgi:hypothetical protein